MKQSLYKYYLGSEGHNQYKYEMQKTLIKYLITIIIEKVYKYCEARGL